MTSNLLQGVLKHSAYERLDALVHDKDDSDDELVNVVRRSVFLRASSLLTVRYLVFTSRNTRTLSPIDAPLITFSWSTWSPRPWTCTYVIRQTIYRSPQGISY